MIVNRGQRRGVVVRRNIRRAAVANAARIVGNALYNRVKNYRFKSGKTKSRLESNLKSEPYVGKPSKIVKRILQNSGIAQAQTGNELSVFKTSVGKYPKLKPNRLLKLMKAGMTDITLRAQGITNYDTNVGYYVLPNRSYTDGSLDVTIPMHVWDLSILPNTRANIVAGHYYGWDSTAAAANLVRGPLPVQQPDGTKQLVGTWQQEVVNGSLQRGEFPYASSAMHDWSEIRLNLYGARKRGTTYYIDFVRCKDEFSNLIEANTANPDLKDLVRTLQSPLIYSNLQSHNMKNLKKLQIVKSYKFYVPGGSADDLDTVGKIKEFRCFLREGKVYNLAWQDKAGSEANDIPHAQEDGADYVNKQSPHDHPWLSSRLYMIVRAFAPERGENTTAFWEGLDPDLGAFGAGANPLIEPSYDLIIRNKWTLPS